MLPLGPAGIIWLVLVSTAAQAREAEQQHQVSKANESLPTGQPGLFVLTTPDEGEQCCCSANHQMLVEVGKIAAQLTELGKEVNRMNKELKSKPKPKPVSEPKPVCEKHPKPLPPEKAPHQEPAQRACARSCLQLRDQGGSPQDGVYWFTGMPVPVMCDFSLDGGGWTLLLTVVSNENWNQLNVLGRDERSPSLSADYSILRHADAIRDLGKGSQFAYRIEAKAGEGRQHWGGVWWAPRHYSFLHQSNSQTEVTLVKKFDNWQYSDNYGIGKRMPWLNPTGKSSILTTSVSGTSLWWGTLVSLGKQFKPNPWILHSQARQSGTVLYWMREEIA